MLRRDFLKLAIKTGVIAMIPNDLMALDSFMNKNNFISSSEFGEDFIWGVSTAAYQIEGACDIGDKSLSIWDHFSHKRRKIKNRDNGDIACDFYNRYKEDLGLL